MMLVLIRVPTPIRRMEMQSVPHIRSEMEASRPMQSARRLIVPMIGSRLESPMQAAASPK